MTFILHRDGNHTQRDLAVQGTAQLPAERWLQVWPAAWPRHISPPLPRLGETSPLAVWGQVRAGQRRGPRTSACPPIAVCPVSLCQHGWLGPGPDPGPSRCGASASARRRAGPVSPPGRSAPQAPLSLAPGVISSPQAAGCESLGPGAHVCWPALAPAPFPEARTRVLDRHPGRHSGGVPTSKGGTRT